MAVMEHHSAGLRTKPDDSPIKLRDNAPNTLSQISSVMSEKESSIKKTAAGTSSIIAGHKEGNSSHLRSGLIQPRGHKVKNVLKEQEKKLKLLDDQNKRTHKMIMQFNNRDDPFAETGSADVCKEAESPLLRETKKVKVVKPKISDFDLMEIVGIGNFGKVHKAFNKKSNRLCALKVLKKESVAAMKHVDHIINEREVL